jgi:hypothetical protein
LRELEANSFVIKKKSRLKVFSVKVFLGALLQKERSAKSANWNGDSWKENINYLLFILFVK